MSGDDTVSVNALRLHYKEHDYINSVEGVLKVLSVIACMCAGAAWLGAGGGCGGGWGAAVALGDAAALALLAALALSAAPQRAPHLWLYTDVTVSALAGVLLLVSAALDSLYCRLDSFPAYFYLVSSVAAAGMAVGGAGAGYARAMGRIDAARPRTEPRAPTQPEPDLDV